ncbi:MAG: ABC transporter substrate-binding protein [Chlorobiaceae bacterium]|nr:ABC transporter substrate-binding protein [Chlorobiaceae bacterium]
MKTRLFSGISRIVMPFTLFFLVSPLFLLDASPALKKARLVTLWQPQAQFAGYYAALDRGIYAKHGIDLTIIPGGAVISPAEMLRSGKADFAVLWLASALRERDAGVQLINLSQVLQRSSMMLVSRKTAGITGIEALNGRKVSLWDGTLSLLPRFLFRKYGITVNEVRQSYTVNLFLRGGVDAASAMWYNEYHVMLESGIDADELNVLFLNDYGVNFPEDGLYTLEKTVRNEPQLTAAFIDASLEGWRYAFAHPEESVDIIIRHMHKAHIPANRAHQKWMLDRMRDLSGSKGSEHMPGVLSRTDYETLGREMKAAGLIRSYPSFGTFTGKSHEGQ